LTNDDGIYAPGLAALEHELARLGDVIVVAPATEQSGVGHSITYLRPLVVKEVFEGQRRRGYAIEGSPADCVKLGIFECCPRQPDLVVSGINSGLNAGINVLYSGTVAAAIEGAFFGITSFAISMEYDEHADHQRAAKVAVEVIEQVLAQSKFAESGGSGRPEARLFNVNLPQAALAVSTPKARCTAMKLTRSKDHFEKRVDPLGRNYFWATGEKRNPDIGEDSDEAVLREGLISITPLDFDLTRHDILARMRAWKFDLQLSD
jgi:5'-nucleotidase